MQFKTVLRVALLIGFCVFAVPSLAEDSTRVNQQDWEFLSLINAYRSSSSQCWDGNQWTPWPSSNHTLSLSTSLTVAAENYSRFLANNSGCFDHNCDGRSLAQRVQAEQYPGSFIGENLYAGSQPAQDALNRWKGSDGHNKNMLHCAFRAIGIGQAYNANSTYRWYWVTDFGNVEHQTKLTCDDCTPPSVRITFPSDGSSIQHGTKVSVQATASDDGGILFVEFYINGNLEGASSGPFVFDWDTGNYLGPVTLVVKAYDSAENTATYAVLVNIR